MKIGAEMKKIKLSLTVTEDVNNMLEAIAKRSSSGNKSEALRKAIALLDVADEAKSKNQSMAVVDNNGKIISKIIGL